MEQVTFRPFEGVFQAEEERPRRYQDKGERFTPRTRNAKNRRGKQKRTKGRKNPF